MSEIGGEAAEAKRAWGGRPKQVSWPTAAVKPNFERQSQWGQNIEEK